MVFLLSAPLSNEISTRILVAVTDYKDNPEISEDRVTLDYAVSVVNEFLKEAKFYAENDPHPQSYLVHILRYHPDEETGPAAGSEIIITP